MEDEARYLDELLIAANAVVRATRIDRIIQIVQDRFVDQPVLFFTEYKKTQALMMSALISRYGVDSVGFINGDKKLVGYAQSFDLSGLKDVPPVDLPALKPFFTSALIANSRRPKTDGQSLAFKTPDKWLNHPAIKREYSGLVFDRTVKLESGSDLVGVGHPLVTRALQQA